MATLCVLSRVTPFAIPLSADAAEARAGGAPHASERFNEQRPAELVTSFNESTVREILRRDARELLFLQLAQAVRVRVRARVRGRVGGRGRGRARARVRVRVSAAAAAGGGAAG